MSAAPVMSITDELIAELEALAIEVKGWNMPVAFQEPEEGFLPDDWDWHVGQIDEEDNRYPVLHINAHQYDSGDSEKVARYYAACNRDTILALLAERAELKRDADRYLWLRDRLVGASFDWDDEGMTVIAFQMPGSITVSANCDKVVDDAMQAAQ